MLRGLVNGERIWWSLDTRSLSVAIEEANKKLDALQGVQTGRVSVDDAVERFMRDKIATSFEDQSLRIEEARSKSDTIRKLDDLLSQLRAFALQKRIRVLEEFKTEDLSQFRETWKGAYDHQTQSYRPKSLVGKQKYQETLKSFFKLNSHTTSGGSARIPHRSCRRSGLRNGSAAHRIRRRTSSVCLLRSNPHFRRSRTRCERSS